MAAASNTVPSTTAIGQAGTIAAANTDPTPQTHPPTPATDPTDQSQCFLIAAIFTATVLGKSAGVSAGS